ncbi:uncharacterized protein TNCV_1382461 [Trichonephila clavipes]|nr:uncharacterized protein TNCV_1382461 [Trichonephila clavipes]
MREKTLSYWRKTLLMHCRESCTFSVAVATELNVFSVFQKFLQYTVGDWLTNTFKKEFLYFDYEHIFGGDQGDTPGIMDEILTTARDLELEVNEDDIEELIKGHEDELTIEELQEILNEEHQETQ